MSSNRWKELLHLKKIYQNQNPRRAESTQKNTQPSSRSVMHFLHHSSKSTFCASNLSFPLLRESSDGQSISISSRRSVSSSPDLAKVRTPSSAAGEATTASPKAFATPPAAARAALAQSRQDFCGRQGKKTKDIKENKNKKIYKKKVLGSIDGAT